MRRIVMVATFGALVLSLAVAARGAEEAKDRVLVKTGVVKKVDVDAKQVVVMVKRELTFAVTAATKIVQGDEAKQLTDLKVDTRVTVDYTREGDTRTATKIAILVDKSEK